VSTSPDAGDAPTLVLVGRVRHAHGIKGELVIEPLTDAPDATFASGRRLFAGTVDGDPMPDRRELHVHGSRPFKEGVIVKFAEIADRTEAEKWRQRYVLAPRDELEPPRDGEVYVHDLVGMQAVLANGDAVGEIVGTYELPHGLMLELQRPGTAARDTMLVPFREEFVRDVDAAARRVVLAPPDGFFD
jgi:16S rRNA processing protein RimM